METQVKVQLTTQAVVTWKRCITHLLLSLALLTNSVSAIAHPIVQYWQNRTGSHEGMLLEPRFSYYTTNENYALAGPPVPLPATATVTRMYFDINGSYGLNDDFFIFGRLSMLSTRVSYPTNLNENTSAGLSDQLIGAAYRVYHSDGGFSINLQGEVSLPMYQRADTKQNNKPYLGDQSVDMIFGSFAEIPLGQDFYAEAGAGYLYRSRGYSAAIPLSLMLKHDPANSGIVFSAGIRGQHSLATDKYPIALSEALLGAAGSNLIDGSNPSWLVGQANIGYKFDSGHSVYALVAFPFSGTSAPKGTQISIGAVFDFDSPVKKRDVRKAKVRPNQFTNYDLEAKVLSINDNFYLAKIDKGTGDGLEKGQLFDVFRVKQDPVTGQKTETLVARAKVNHLKNDQAALGVLEYFVDQSIEAGFIARRVLP